MADNSKTIILREHQCIPEPDASLIREALAADGQSEFMGTPKQLGLKAYGSDIRSSYYVGACNIAPGAPDVVVLPKIESLDFISMLSECIAYAPSADYFSLCYDIYPDGQPIECAECYDILSPLLAMHYLQVMGKLAAKGLARDYTHIEENLRCKLKGHVHPVKNWQTNELKARRDRIYCSYSEYTSDIPVNRYLKKALLIALRCLDSTEAKSSSHRSEPIRRLRIRLEESMHTIGADAPSRISISRRRNKLNPHYPEALRIATAIIRHEECSITEHSVIRKYVYPFWIDFSRLFEVYVLALLRRAYGTDIEFQVRGATAVADYVHRRRHIVIDAKYKPGYADRGYNIEDIREISGNARDISICSRFIDYSGTEPACLIIYPDMKGVERFEGPILELPETHPIPQFRSFFKIGVKLPVL